MLNESSANVGNARRNASGKPIQAALAAVLLGVALAALAAFGAPAPAEAHAAQEGDRLAAQAMTALDTQAAELLNSKGLRIVEVSLGYSHSAAIDYNGDLWVWGNNSFGQVGNGKVENSVTTPQKVLQNVKQVALGEFHTLAVTKDGALWAWGENRQGQLGDGTTQTHYTPKKVTTGVSTVAAGANHSAAIKADGSLWLWGYNGNGQLGDGTVISQNAPKKVMSGISQVSLSRNHTLALQSNGTLWAWGYNESGQLGDGTYTRSLIPKNVMSGVAQASAGDSYSAAVKKDGTLYTWGSSSYGQLGYDASGHRPNPTKIMSGVSSAVAGKGTIGAAVQKNGSLFMWGRNDHGQVGNKTTATQVTPVLVLSNVSKVALGNMHSAAIENDGSLWVWGSGSSGQLGNGGTEDVTSPHRLAEGATKLAGGNVRLAQTSYTYNGTAQKPAAVVTYNGATLKQNTHYTVSYANNVNAGTATATITGIGNYGGTIAKTFTIGKASIAGASATLSATSFTYNGSPRTPTVKVKLGSRVLAGNADYAVAYPSSRTNVGAYKLTVTGVGNYTGSLTRSYTVSPAASSIKSAKAIRYAPSGAAKVVWKKVAKQCDGYAVWLSTSKSFAGSKTKKSTFKSSSSIGKKCSFSGAGLKKGATYYVKVRTYKKAGGKTYYSRWSSVKKFKTYK